MSVMCILVLVIFEAPIKIISCVLHVYSVHMQSYIQYPSSKERDHNTATSTLGMHSHAVESFGEIGISPSFESFLHNHLNETLHPLQELYELSDISLFAGVPHHPDGESDTFWPYSPVCARSCQPRLKRIGF